MVECFLALALISAFLYISYRLFKWRNAQPEQEQVSNFKNVCSSVHVLEEMAEQIEALDEIITDLNTCNSKHLKSVKLSIHSVLGHINEYTLLADGTDYSSRQLLDLVQAERMMKREELLRAIAELHTYGTISRAYSSRGENSEQEQESETDQ